MGAAGARDQQFERDRADAAPRRGIDHDAVEPGLPDQRVQHLSRLGIGALHQREMRLAEQQADRIIDDDARQRIADAGPPVAHRDIFPADPARPLDLLGKTVVEDVIERAIQHPPEHIEPPGPLRQILVHGMALE